MKPKSSASSASTPPAASAAALTASTSSRDETLKQYSASACVVGSAIGSFENSANFSRLSSMTNACSPTSMHVAVSSVNIGLKLNPSCVKNAVLRSTSATGMFTNSMRPGCAGVLMVGLQSGGSTAYGPQTGPADRTHRSESWLSRTGAGGGRHETASAMPAPIVTSA